MPLEFLRKCEFSPSQCTNKIMRNLKIKVSFMSYFSSPIVKHIRFSWRLFVNSNYTHRPQTLIGMSPLLHPCWPSLPPNTENHYYQITIKRGFFVPKKYKFLVKANKELRKTIKLWTKISLVNKLNRWYICKWDLSHNSSSYLFCLGFINHPAWDPARSHTLLQ